MRTKGFTLIEMIIVIAIIAILAGVFLTGFTGFRQNAQDTRRIADLNNMRNYLEAYYAKTRAYPATLAGLLTAGIGVNSVPTDPAGGTSYFYGTDGGGTPQNYVVGATLNVGNAALNDSADQAAGDAPIYGVDCTDPVYCLRN